MTRHVKFLEILFSLFWNGQLSLQKEVKSPKDRGLGLWLENTVFHLFVFLMSSTLAGGCSAQIMNDFSGFPAQDLGHQHSAHLRTPYLCPCPGLHLSPSPVSYSPVRLQQDQAPDPHNPAWPWDPLSQAHILAWSWLVPREVLLAGVAEHETGSKDTCGELLTHMVTQGVDVCSWLTKLFSSSCSNMERYIL